MPVGGNRFWGGPVDSSDVIESPVATLADELMCELLAEAANSTALASCHELSLSLAKASNLRYHNFPAPDQEPGLGDFSDMLVVHVRETAAYIQAWREAEAAASAAPQQPSETPASAAVDRLGSIELSMPNASEASRLSKWKRSGQETLAELEDRIFKLSTAFKKRFSITEPSMGPSLISAAMTSPSAAAAATAALQATGASFGAEAEPSPGIFYRMMERLGEVSGQPSESEQPPAPSGARRVDETGDVDIVIASPNPSSNIAPSADGPEEPEVNDTVTSDDLDFGDRVLEFLKDKLGWNGSFPFPCTWRACSRIQT